MIYARALLSLLALAATAPAPPPSPLPPVAVKPALWVVKQGGATVYLFGTVHVLKPGLGWFDTAVKKAFDRSSEVVLEMLEPAPEAMQAIVVAHAITPATAPTLTETLPPAKRAAYAKAVESIGMPATSFDHFKPWFAAVNLSLRPLIMAGFDPASGPESIITNAAEVTHKPLVGLETADQQIGYFDRLSQPAQIAFLTDTVDELPKEAAQMNEMVADWSKGDPAALAVLMNDDLKASPELAETILYERNARWADWVKARLGKPGTVFIAVGAGHLAGQRSLIEDLAAKGIKAERVAY